MAFVRHGTLVAGQVASVVLPARYVSDVEVLNLGASDRIYFIVTTARTASSEPTVEGDDVEVLAPGSALELRISAGSTVKLISNGTPAYSVRAG